MRSLLRNNPRGMTLVEVMVALVMLGLVTIPLLRFFVESDRLTVDARRRVDAVNYAQQLLEGVKGLPYDQVGRVAGPAAAGNQVRLDPDLYDDSFLKSGGRSDYLIMITSGTGNGQVRRITDYDDLTHTATVNQPWNTSPDSTSSYVILRNGEGGCGLVRGAGANTVTLAEADNELQDFYRDWQIEISGGKGTGQVRRVLSYDAAVKAVTVNQDWATVPDATSIYRLYRYRYMIQIEKQSSELKTVTVIVYYRVGSAEKTVALTTDKLRG